jgi:hypothetical protein
LATVDDRKETSLRACVAHMLDIDVSEVPKKREANMGQWLSSRNLGLVPVASPETFQWPGHFLGLRRDSSTWAVFFGIPPGIVYDPMAEPDGKKDATIDAAFVLAKHDPRRGTEPSSGTESVGTVELIALAAEAEGANMRRLRADLHQRLLGNGYCTRPKELDCQFETICETCSFFDTDADFAPTLTRQRDHAAEREQLDRVDLFNLLLDRIDEEEIA